MDRRGFSARRLAQLRPGLIYLSETNRPWALRKGFENIAQAATGVSTDHGSEDSPIMCPALFMTDYGTGYLGALGVLAALIRRAKEGGSCHVRVSLCRTAMHFQDLGEVPMDERRSKLTGRLQEGIASSILPAAAINDINYSAANPDANRPRHDHAHGTSSSIQQNEGFLGTAHRLLGRQQSRMARSPSLLNVRDGGFALG
jgi:hypothetical protein